jgi:hypothetical protein
MNAVIRSPVALDRVRDAVASLLAAGPVEITWRPWKAKRSDAQNRYLWGVVYRTLRDATGQIEADWHEYMLGEWSGWETYELFGRRKVRPLRRSGKLNVGEFCDYVAFV